MLKPRNKPGEREPQTRINERISSHEVRVIAADGGQLGIMKVTDALRAAKEAGLDLVEVSPTAQPPVCKIMDFGKFKYEQKKKAAEAKKHQHQVLLKEVKFRPKIEKHDYDFKLRHVREFLEEGNKVKITVRFRGREITRPELALNVIDRVEKDVEDIGQMEIRPNREGRTMIAVLMPGAKTPKKKPVKSEAPQQAKTADAGEKASDASADS